MRNQKGNGAATVAGVAAVAVLTALAAALIFGMETGTAGAVLVVLVIAVSALSGWLAGRYRHIREWNHYMYMKGYHEGIARNTTVVYHPEGRCTFTVSDWEEVLGCRERLQ